MKLRQRPGRERWPSLVSSPAMDSWGRGSLLSLAIVTHVSTPGGPPTVSPLGSSCVSCQERGFLKALSFSCSCRGQYFYPASASCLLAGGFCFLGLGFAISDKEQAFLSHQNREVALLMESAAGSPGPWPTHTSPLLPQPPVAPRQPSQPVQEWKPGQLVGRGETGASLLQEMEKSTLIRQEQLKRHSSLGVCCSLGVGSSLQVSVWIPLSSAHPAQKQQGPDTVIVKCRSWIGSKNAPSYGTWEIIWMFPGTNKDGGVLSLHVPTAQEMGRQTLVTNKSPHLLSACCMPRPMSSTRRDGLI